MGDATIFSTDPALFVTGDEARVAATSLRAYFERYTGSRFDTLADESHPNEITPRDILAVSMLSVNVPPGVTVWLLERGKDDVSRLLREVPSETPIWEVDENFLIDDTSELVTLWSVLQSVSAQWPRTDGANEVGPVTAGKLLAAKRPKLVPIYDQHVDRALGGRPGRWWASWRHAFRSTDLADQARAVRDVAASEGASVQHLSELRVLDIAIWMRVHGFESHEKLKDDERYLTPLRA